MSSIQLARVSRIHFIGIGGIGMSALARFFLFEKKVVSGSDRATSAITNALVKEGVQIYVSQVASNVTSDIELIVYTEAMSPEHEEMVAARALGVPMMNYFDALGLVANPYYLIAVAGTHGKTTTTAMLTDVFEVAEKDPTAIIGSLRASTHSNFRAGKSKYAIIEACEYKRDFLSLTPDVLVMTNIEYEHTDYYRDLADVQAAFKTLVGQVREGGYVVTNAKDPIIAAVVQDASVPVLDYTEYLDVQTSMKQPGMHVRMNAAAALTVAVREKLDRSRASATLSAYAGTWRRFEYKGTCNGAPVYDDYGHHPTEIKATIAGARELYPDKQLTVIFEPHTFSRTATLFADFARAFSGANRVFLLPIYAAREENTWGVSSRELAVKTLAYVPETSYVASLEDAERTLREVVTGDDVVLVMGAGTVTKLASFLTI